MYNNAIRGVLSHGHRQNSVSSATRFSSYASVQTHTQPNKQIHKQTYLLEYFATLMEQSNKSTISLQIPVAVTQTDKPFSSLQLHS